MAVKRWAFSKQANQVVINLPSGKPIGLLLRFLLLGQVKNYFFNYLPKSLDKFKRAQRIPYPNFVIERSDYTQNDISSVPSEHAY
jgi:hypothetical protein